MPRFFRYGFPYQYYYNNFPSYAPMAKPSINNSGVSSAHVMKPEPVEPLKEKSERSVHSSSDLVWFDLFGIKLYFDDVLILSLLFFLYKEEVKDEGLFLALVLLLIS